MVVQPKTEALQRTRQHPRADVDQPVLCGRDGSYHPGVVVNVSIGGVFLKTSIPKAEPGDVLRIVLPVPGESFPRLVEAEVVWAQQHTATDGMPRGIGMKFVNLRPDDESAIGVWVDVCLHCDGLSLE